MQTSKSTRVPQGTSKSIDSRKGTVGDSIRSKGSQRKAIPSGMSIGPDILKFEFDSLLSVHAGFKLEFDEDISFILTDQLVRSVSNYFKLMGKEFNYEMTNQIEVDCFNLYKILKSALNDDIELNFITDNSNLQINLYKAINDFPDFILFYYPVGVVKQMEEKLADLYIKFSAFYSKSQRIPFPEDNRDFGYYLSDYEYILEEEMESEDYDIENGEYFKSLIQNYNEGEAHYYFDLIKSINYNADELLSELKSYLNLENDNSDFVQLMIDGVNLLRTDCIMDYEYIPDTDSEDGYCEFDRIFCMIWLDDMLCEYATEMFNTDAMELECLGPYQVLTLTPNTKELIQIDNTYPTRFANWHRDFYVKQMEYEPTNN